MNKLNLKWREIDGGQWQYIAWSSFLLDSVIGVCGPSEKEEYKGKFWYRTRPVYGIEEPKFGYTESLESAKLCVEEGLGKTINRWKNLSELENKFYAENI